ncbi:MAG: DUF362 domain-containing protein [Treponemataceae bacterium]|nr:MAG: DUF362 domain-containing protein [Treponemataceae bacterium]
MSDVYFTNFRTSFSENIPQKFTRLLKTAGIEKIDFAGKYTAVKIHFGEPGNLAFLRPNFAKALIDIIKAKGGKVFLTDANTLYVGGRKNALDHLEAAYENGYSPFSTGAHVIIADGLKGTDEALVPLADGEFVKEAKIGRAIMDADIVISLSHFKGHECASFGGALKNIGMGSGSRAGKMEMHSAGKPHVETGACIGCGACQKNCAHNAITIAAKKASIDHAKCAGCGRCIGVCPKDAVKPASDESFDVLNKKIAEYSAAVLRGKPSFHISVAMDISPYCDCHAENDVPIVPDVGMFASFDPVAIDKAAWDAVKKQERAKGSILDEREHTHGDHFIDVHPETNGITQLTHAEKLGLGEISYKLIEI